MRKISNNPTYNPSYCFWLSHPISFEFAHPLAQTAKILAGHALIQASRAASEQAPEFELVGCFF